MCDPKLRGKEWLLKRPIYQELTLQDCLAGDVVDEDSEFEDEKTDYTEDAKQQSDRSQKLKAWRSALTSTRRRFLGSKRIKLTLTYLYQNVKPCHRMKG
jgi:hypothetical protein